MRVGKKDTMNLVTIVGARPQFIKAAVLSRYVRNNPSCGITEILLHTGQHYDQNMSDVFFEEMDIPRPDINLHVGSGNHGKTTGLMLEQIEDVILEKKLFFSQTLYYHEGYYRVGRVS
jgi:UDP-GlcNAc3NAcA epimerase